VNAVVKKQLFEVGHDPAILSVHGLSAGCIISVLKAGIPAGNHGANVVSIARHAPGIFQRRAAASGDAAHLF
jgi:hypothetical protein